MKTRKGLAAGQAHLQGAHHTLRILGVHAGGVRRIQTFQFIHQHLQSFRFQTGIESGSDGQVGRHGVEPFEDGLHIQPAATAQNGALAVGKPLFEPSQRIRFELPCTVEGIGLEKVHEMVGHCCALFGSGLGRADGHAAVHLPGIGVQDFAVQGLGNGDGEGCFTDGRRADDNHQERALLLASVFREGRKLCCAGPVHSEQVDVVIDVFHAGRLVVVLVEVGIDFGIAGFGIVAEDVVK